MPIKVTILNKSKFLPSSSGGIILDKNERHNGPIKPVVIPSSFEK